MYVKYISPWFHYKYIHYVSHRFNEIFLIQINFSIKSIRNKQLVIRAIKKPRQMSNYEHNDYSK